MQLILCQLRTAINDFSGDKMDGNAGFSGVYKVLRDDPWFTNSVLGFQMTILMSRLGSY